MANENGNPNPGIAKAGEATQFSSDRQDQEEISRKGAEEKHRRSSIRSSQRRLSGYVPGVGVDITGTPKSPTANQLAQAFGKGRKFDDLTMAEIMAITSARQAMGNPKAMENYIVNTEGKLIDKKADLPAGGSFAALVEAAANLERLEQGEDDEDEESNS